MPGPKLGSALVALLLASWLQACAPPANGPRGGESAASSAPAGLQASAAPTAAASNAQPPPSLRQFDMPLVSTAASMVPFWLAEDQGIFRRYGLEPTLVQLPPATAAQALSAGSAPVAAAGGSVVSAWVGGATDLVFIAGNSNTAPYRVIVRPDITRMEELRGKSIGLTTPGASPTVAMAEVLRRYGLEPERDVTFTYLRDTAATVAGLLTGVVQGIATSSPQAEQALADGNRLLLDMRDLDVPILGPQLATTRAIIERDPDLLRNVLMTYVEGVKVARERPEDGISAIVRGARLDDRTLAELAYHEYYPLWDYRLSEPAIQTLLDNMDVPGAATARPAAMMDHRFIRELESNNWLATHWRAP